MNDEDAQALLGQLRAAVARLAEPAADQIEYLDELGVSPLADELALEVDDVVGAVLGDRHLLSADQRYAVIGFDRRLDDMSGAHNAHLWTVDALTAAAEWSALRGAAQEVLAHFPRPDDA